VTDLIEPPTRAEDRVGRLADRLHRARSAGELLDATAIAEVAGLSLAEAYDAQERLTGIRLSEGRLRVGHKLGYTSAVMRRQMGVDEPNHGPILDDMVLADGATTDRFRHPRVEPEIGVVLGRDLSGPDLMVHEVAAAVAEVRTCLEIVDSIWRDYRFTVEQNTADGSSAAGVVVGPVLDVDPAACHRFPVDVLQDGVSVATGTSAAPGGHPLAGVAWLCARLGPSGLRAGELVITGGLTAALPLPAGSTMEAWFGGSAAVRVTRG
jgi:2-keto-4-pentenoate hydratase